MPRYVEKMRLPIALTALMLVTPAWSYDLPRYDPESACKRIAMLSPPENRAASEHVCIDNEQMAYERLKSEWDQATAEEQMESMTVRGGPERTYSFLEGHLGSLLARDEAIRQRNELSQPKQFKFD